MSRAEAVTEDRVREAVLERTVREALAQVAALRGALAELMDQEKARKQRKKGGRS